eukprot:TRINITY_DN6244_c0_g2_i1.p1 TRINITY_DN6244_c0_g2~~TRINITY_DN6244_c0_g2_i1.p1  ORF type:complete len:565 (+),score=80.94 TRINITY_DN6244_c0_g2_i1:91-1785(+)
MPRNLSLPGMHAHIRSTIISIKKDTRPVSVDLARTVEVRDVMPGSEEGLKEFFSEIGEVECVNAVGEIYQVMFAEEEDAESALTYDKKTLNGETITVVKPERRTTRIQGKTTAFISSVFNLLNAIVGSGVLGLAYIMKGTGVALFIFLMCIMVVVVDYSLQLLIAAALTTKKRGEVISYERLGFLAWGERGRILVSLMIIIQNTGAMVGAFKVFKDVIHEIMVLVVSDSLKNSLLTNSDFMTSVAAFVMFIPACSTKIGVIAYVGVVAVGLTTLFVIFATVKSQLLSREHTCQDECDLYYVHPTVDTFLALPTMCFSFVCHTSLLPVFHELEVADELGRTRRSQKRMTLAVHIALVLAFILYIFGAFFGYYTFRGHTNQDLLKNYEDAEKDAPLSVAVRLLFMWAVLMSIPLLIFPYRRSLENLADAVRNIYDKPIPPPREGIHFYSVHIGQTFIIIGVMLAGAITVPHITTVFSAVGATSSVFLVFILPASLYIKICLGINNLEKLRKKGSLLTTDLLNDQREEEATPLPFAYVGPMVLLISGCVLFVVSWAGLLYRWITGAN